MQKYYLGVDGGNTKTDYLLCTTEGEFVDLYHTGTCSHETFAEGYDAMERTMRDQLSHLLDKNGISLGDIEAAGLGLAGADLPSQVKELKKRVEKIGLVRYGLFNDGILGIKGASDSGIGLCAVNGTGTVIVGTDEKGDILQVGGVGSLSGDAAGGGHASRQSIALLYDYYYRCGENSIIFPKLVELLNADIDDLLTLVSDSGLLRKHSVEINQICAQAAVEGDKLAKEIFDGMGRSIARSAAGCIRRMCFEKQEFIDIVLVGSIWHKIPYKNMQDVFIQTTEELSGKKCRAIELKVPPAVGGILWAKEIADGAPASPVYRKKLLETVRMTY